MGKKSRMLKAMQKAELEYQATLPEPTAYEARLIEFLNNNSKEYEVPDPDKKIAKVFEQSDLRDEWGIGNGNDWFTIYKNSGRICVFTSGIGDLDFCKFSEEFQMLVSKAVRTTKNLKEANVKV